MAKNVTETIRKFVKFLNNKEEQGGFWLPNIQRSFVWKEEQIEKLYDSLLRRYPIGSLLVWKTKSKMKRRKFIDNYIPNISLANFFVSQDDSPKMLVLDGQQRLQALYIGLFGSYNKKELYINILSGNMVAPEDIKYEFKFKTNADFPYIKVKEIVMPEGLTSHIIKRLKINMKNMDEDEKDRITENIDLIRYVFNMEENIIYQLVDSIEDSETYTEDDIVEIFIRANSGGTLLSKSDLLFSLLTVSWDDAEEKMDELLTDLNQTGYKFDKDFILKVCLILLDKGSKYEIKKFRDPNLKTNIEEKWKDISESIRAVKDFIYGETFLRTDKTLPSYLSLIPIIYDRYHFKQTWAERKSDFFEYLVKANLTRVFGGASESFIDGLIENVRKNKGLKKKEIFEYIRSKGKSIELDEQSLFNINYSSKEIHLLFNIWYGFNYQPSYKNNLPQIDHIFPQSELKKIKVENPKTGKRNVTKYKKEKRDQLANLMLLTAEENGAGEKSSKMPEEWFEDKDDDYLEKHLIPKDKELWKIEKFEMFIDERKKLILQKFKDLIYRVKDNDSPATKMIGSNNTDNK